MIHSYQSIKRQMKKCKFQLQQIVNQCVPVGESPWLCVERSSVQFSSVAQSCPTLCNPMNRSRPGLPLHHQLPESTETHVHRVGDVIQTSHPLSFLAASESFQMSQLFTSSGQSIGVSTSASVPMNIQDWSPLGWTGWISLQSKGLKSLFSNTVLQKHQFFGAQLSF